MANTQIRGTTQIISGSIDKTRVDSTIIRADGVNAFTADHSLGGFKITNVAAPVGANDVVNKSYVDAVANGRPPKDSVRAATTAALPANTRTGNVITASANGALPAQDAVTLVANDRLLIKDEAAGANNGLYIVTTVGTGATAFVLTRTTDADETAEVMPGMTTFVSEGTTNGNKRYTLTTDAPITLNTTALTFTVDSSSQTYIGGAGITESGYTFNVVATDNSLLVNANDMQVKLDGTSIALGASGLKVSDAKFKTRITPSGAINGTNTAFTLPDTPIADSEAGYLNGVLMEPGAGNDYTISGAAVTMLAAPQTGDRLRFMYRIA